MKYKTRFKMRKSTKPKVGSLTSKISKRGRKGKRKTIKLIKN